MLRTELDVYVRLNVPTLLFLIFGSLSSDTALADNSLWDDVGRLGKALELSQFCGKHQGHPRCKELEAQRAFCAKHPMDAERCDPPSAGKLLQWCDSQDSNDHAHCAGVLDAELTDGAAPQLGSPPIKLSEPEPALQCVPVEVLREPEQIRILFVREAHNHPEVLHLSARRLLYYALAKTFPCPNPLKEP